jgi:hypothetical protein
MTRIQTLCFAAALLLASFGAAIGSRGSSLTSVPSYQDPRLQRGSGLQRIRSIRDRINRLKYPNQRQSQFSPAPGLPPRYPITRQRQLFSRKNDLHQPPQTHQNNRTVETENPFNIPKTKLRQAPVKSEFNPQSQRFDSVPLEDSDLKRDDSDITGRGSPFLVGASDLPKDGHQTFKPKIPPPTHAKILAILEKCKGLAPQLGEKSEKGEKAGDLYRRHCFDLVESLAIPRGLDIFYSVQGSYLASVGRHREANHYFTLLYQKEPTSFEGNYLFINNLANLGETEMAQELLVFYQDQGNRKNLDQSQKQRLDALQESLRQQLGP